MGRVRRRIASNAGVRRLRRTTETLVTPRVRVDLNSQHTRLLQVESIVAAEASAAGEVHVRLDEIHVRLDEIHVRLDEIERHLPRLLNVIASGDGAARILRRELDDLREHVDDRHRRVTKVSTELTESTQCHTDTQRWLLGRVEMIRAEMLYELRYGRVPDPTGSASVEILVPSSLRPDDGSLRINLGCGHEPLDGFANVDQRKIPGVDVVAPVDELPVEAGSVAEIFSAHLLEHFPEEQLRRQLLPYWVGLLHPGGVFRAVVPDMSAMAQKFASGETDFPTFRTVTYGGQEYEGDFHFTGFTADHLGGLLEEAGLTDIKVTATGRINGECLEIEISATRPR